jgi:hypothetical protein
MKDSLIFNVNLTHKLFIATCARRSKQTQIFTDVAHEKLSNIYTIIFMRMQQRNCFKIAKAFF